MSGEHERTPCDMVRKFVPILTECGESTFYQLNLTKRKIYETKAKWKIDNENE